MPLINFFIIIDSNYNEGKWIFTLELNPDHEIFKGHFPDMPIVPGVCMIEMVRIAIEKVNLNSVRLKSASNVKFLSPISPNENPFLLLELILNQIGEVEIHAEAKLYMEELVFFKFDGVFINYLGKY